MKTPLKKHRLVTYVEADLLKWITMQAKQSRLNESTFIRQILAKQMDDTKVN